MKYSFLIIVLNFILISCASDENSDNNVLSSVEIGAQIWQSKNLDVSKYRDGTPIPQVTDPTEWNNLTTGAWCYYDNDPANGVIYGKLYNWYAVAGIHDNDPNTPNKILAPIGWHIPSAFEYSTLINFLGGENIAGGKMKSTETLWESPNIGATNISGFSALPGGGRFYLGSFDTVSNTCWLWCASESNNIYGTLIYTESYDARITASTNESEEALWNTWGCPVRCIKN